MLDTLLKAINIANTDGAKVLQIEIEDLMLLKREIERLRHKNKQLDQEIAQLRCEVLKKPIRLRAYA